MHVLRADPFSSSLPLFKRSRRTQFVSQDLTLDVRIFCQGRTIRMAMFASRKMPDFWPIYVVWRPYNLVFTFIAATCAVVRLMFLDLLIIYYYFIFMIITKFYFSFSDLQRK